MKKKKKPKIRELLPIFKNSQSNKGLLGIGRILNKRKSGLPFIVDTEADNKQKVWIEEHWEIEWILKTSLGYTINPEKRVFPIRTLFYEGIGTSKEPSYPQSYGRDKFIEIHGTEIF